MVWVIGRVDSRFTLLTTVTLSTKTIPGIYEKTCNDHRVSASEETKCTDENSRIVMVISQESTEVVQGHIKKQKQSKTRASVPFSLNISNGRPAQVQVLSLILLSL